jgi:hypothetical protein
MKWAQREEFMRRFYGKSKKQQEEELRELLGYSMNVIDEPSRYREKVAPSSTKDEVVAPSPAPAPAPAPEK